MCRNCFISCNLQLTNAYLTLHGGVWLNFRSKVAFIVVLRSHGIQMYDILIESFEKNQFETLS